MEYEQTVLSCGLTIVSRRMPGFEGSCIASFTKAGSRNETEANGGVAHFKEHMAFKGTATRSAHRIAADIEKLGSHVNAYTGTDITCYYVRGLRQHIGRAVTILGDVLTHSVYDAVDIGVERGVIMQEIGQYRDDPGSVASDALGTLFLPDQAIGRPILGTERFVLSVGPSDFRAFDAQNYYASNMVVVGTGDFAHADLVGMVEEAFRDLPQAAASPAPREPVRYGGGQVLAGGRFEQVAIAAAWPCPGRGEPGWRAAQRLALALGGSMSSPLFQEIREKRGLVYHVGCHADIADDHGAFLVEAGTGGDANVSELMQVLRDELRRVQDVGITEEDFERATNMVLAASAEYRESPGHLAQHIGRAFFLHGRPPSLVEERSGILAVTSRDVQEAARTIFARMPAIAMAGAAPEADYVSMVRAA
jgi:predicted Zn-dependent peptidase